jgi:hypothetical protein
MPKYNSKAVKMTYNSLVKMLIAKGMFAGVRCGPALKQACSLEELLNNGFAPLG